MVQTPRPSVDPDVISSFGQTRCGQPLSYNRAPSSDLSAWIARLSISKLELQGPKIISCGLFADTAGLRFQLAGDLIVPNNTDDQYHSSEILFCGPQSRLMPVRVRGDFVSIAVSFRPSACAALLGSAVPAFVDQIVDTQQWSPEFLRSQFNPDGTPEDWLCTIENLFRDHISKLGGAQPNPITAKFEEIAFRDPAQSIAQAARDLEVDRRQLERLVLRDFGMPPKQVLKRARALDMASYLRGVGDEDEGDALALRYYDESHLNREFIELFNIAPRQFAARPQPLLTLQLEIRQARRLELLQRIKPGAKRPWQ